MRKKTEKLTTEEFIQRARAVHGDTYDYSRTVYTNTRTKVVIECPVHGWFETLPNTHEMGCTCPKCAHVRQANKMKQYTMSQEDFIRRSKELHDGIDYSLLHFTRTADKVTLRCIKHDYIFQIKASNHICRTHPQTGCVYCSRENRVKAQRGTFEEFIKKAKEEHGDRYDYSKVQWVSDNHKIAIICKEHGEFWQLPVVHVNQKCGCPGCGRLKAINSRKYTKDEFIAMANKVHGDYYKYDKCNFVSMEHYVTVTCPKHGDFSVSAANHVHRRSGCPKCRRPKLEGIVSSWLKSEGISFKQQVKFEWLRNIRKLTLDFFLPNYGVAIECQGNQHFTGTFIDGKNKREDYTAGTPQRYKIKNDQCAAHGIPIIYFVDKDCTLVPDEYLGPVVRNKEELLKTINLWQN